MGRIGLLCHGSNLHRFGIGSNGLGSTLKNAKFKKDNILISTQVHSTQFDLSLFDLSYSTKRVDLILFDLFHSTHFMQSGAVYVPILLSEVEQERSPSGNGDREAIVVGAGLCDGGSERAYTAYASHYEVEVVNYAFLTLKAFRIGMSLIVLGKCHMKGSIQDHIVVSSTIQHLIPRSIVFHRYCW